MQPQAVQNLNSIPKLERLYAILSGRIARLAARNPAILKAWTSVQRDFAAITMNAPPGYVRDPYFWHLAHVAGLAYRYTRREDALQAALLHDSPEDITHRSLDWLNREFGENVMIFVGHVTHKYRNGNWRAKQEHYKQQLMGESIPRESLIISACDKIAQMIRDISFMEVGIPLAYMQRPGKPYRDFAWKFANLLEVYEGRIPAELFRRYKTLVEKYGELYYRLERERGATAD